MVRFLCIAYVRFEIAEGVSEREGGQGLLTSTPRLEGGKCLGMEGRGCFFSFLFLCEVGA